MSAPTAIMDAAALTRLLDELGVTLLVEGLRSILRLPAGTPATTRREIAAAAVRHRDAVFAHYGAADPEPDDGRYCGTCRAWDYSGDDPVGVWQCCRRVDCPRWRPGDGPEWLAAYRARMGRRSWTC